MATDVKYLWRFQYGYKANRGKMESSAFRDGILKTFAGMDTKNSWANKPLPSTPGTSMETFEFESTEERAEAKAALEAYLEKLSDETWVRVKRQYDIANVHKLSIDEFEAIGGRDYKRSRTEMIYYVNCQIRMMATQVEKQNEGWEPKQARKRKIIAEFIRDMIHPEKGFCDNICREAVRECFEWYWNFAEQMPLQKDSNPSIHKMITQFKLLSQKLFDICVPKEESENPIVYTLMNEWFPKGCSDHEAPHINDLSLGKSNCGDEIVDSLMVALTNWDKVVGQDWGATSVDLNGYWKTVASVKILKFFQCQITDVGFKSLTRFMLMSPGAVRELHLSHNQITENGFKHFLTQMLDAPELQKGQHCLVFKPERPQTQKMKVNLGRITNRWQSTYANEKGDWVSKLIKDGCTFSEATARGSYDILKNNYRVDLASGADPVAYEGRDIEPLFLTEKSGFGDDRSSNKLTKNKKKFSKSQTK